MKTTYPNLRSPQFWEEPKILIIKFQQKKIQFFNSLKRESMGEWMYAKIRHLNGIIYNYEIYSNIDDLRIFEILA